MKLYLLRSRHNELLHKYNKLVGQLRASSINPLESSENLTAQLSYVTTVLVTYLLSICTKPFFFLNSNINGKFSTENSSFYFQLVSTTSLQKGEVEFLPMVCNPNNPQNDETNYFNFIFD